MAPKRVIIPDIECKDLTGPIVLVIVGPEQQLFNVHENLIRKSSGFFEKALSGPWAESKTRTVHLKEDEPDVLRRYVHWLYSGTFSILRSDKFAQDYLALVKAYVLGDKLVDIKFMNTVVDQICNQSLLRDHHGGTHAPSSAAIQYAYANSVKDSPLRRLLIYICVSRREISDIESAEATEIPHDVLYDLWRAYLVEGRGGTEPAAQPANYYSR